MGLQAKTIKAVLRKKVNQWAASITDPEVKKLVLRDTICTGGAIASMLLGEPVNDYDLYLKTKEAVLAVCGYYIKEFQANTNSKYDVSIEVDGDRVKILVPSDGIVSEKGAQLVDGLGRVDDVALHLAEAAESAEDKKGKRYRPVFMSANAITLSDKIQVIVRFYGEPDEIHKNYDFTHVTNYWTSSNGHLELKPAALLALLERRLVYQGSLYPICSIIRTRKFINRGWYISAGQYLKMCMQVSDLNLIDLAVLEDQLTGVDTAYFMQLIDALRGHMEKAGKDHVDKTYIMEIIDRIF